MRASQALYDFIGPIALLHEQAGPRLLRLTRLGVFTLWIVKLLLDPLWRLADLPREMFDPIGILSLLPSAVISQLLTTCGLTTLLLVTLAVLVLCLTNRAFPIVSSIAAILLTAYSCLTRGFGPAVHTDIVLLLSTYALAGFAWADYFQAKLGKTSHSSTASWSSYPIVTIASLLCISYMLVGINRAVAGGINVFTGDTMEVFAIDASLRGYYFNTNIGWHIPEWPLIVLMLKTGFPIITLFEILAPLCLASCHFRWVFIPIMLSFHFLSLVLMNIFFFDDMLIYLLLVDWSRKYPALRTGR